MDGSRRDADENIKCETCWIQVLSFKAWKCIQGQWFSYWDSPSSQGVNKTALSSSSELQCLAASSAAQVKCPNSSATGVHSWLAKLFVYKIWWGIDCFPECGIHGQALCSKLSIKSPVTETIHSLQQFTEIFCMEMIKNEWWRKKMGGTNVNCFTDLLW